MIVSKETLKARHAEGFTAEQLAGFYALDVATVNRALRPLALDPALGEPYRPTPVPLDPALGEPYRPTPVPLDPRTGEPYFTVPSEGWGTGWSVGEITRLAAFREVCAVQARHDTLVDQALLAAINQRTGGNYESSLDPRLQELKGRLTNEVYTTHTRWFLDGALLLDSHQPEITYNGADLPAPWETQR